MCFFYLGWDLKGLCIISVYLISKFLLSFLEKNICVSVGVLIVFCDKIVWGLDFLGWKWGDEW